MNILKRFSNNKLLFSLIKMVFPILLVFLFVFNPNISRANELISDKKVQVEFNKKNSEMAKQILNIFPQVVQDVNKSLKIDFDSPVNIFLCENITAFKNFTGINNNMVQAIAVSEFNLIVINAEALNSKTKTDIRHLLEHEAAHLIMGDEIKKYKGKAIPRWLNEGIAQWVSNGANDIFSFQYQESLQSAFLTGNTLPFSSLNYYFPADKSDFILAYAQSLNFVEYLAEEYGKDKLIQLLHTIGLEKNYYDAFFKVYQIPLNESEKEWFRIKKKNNFTLDYYFATHIDFIINFSIGFFAMISFIIVYIRNYRRKKRLEESENIIT